MLMKRLEISGWDGRRRVGRHPGEAFGKKNGGGAQSPTKRGDVPRV